MALIYRSKHLPVCQGRKPKVESITFADRTIEDWNPEKAVVEAENDIKNNELKIYYSGTIAASPVGVSQEDYELIKDLPIADAGIGCVISDQELRQAQYAYSMRYNRLVVKHLKRQGEIKKQSKWYMTPTTWLCTRCGPLRGPYW